MEQSNKKTLRTKLPSLIQKIKKNIFAKKNKKKDFMFKIRFYLSTGEIDTRRPIFVVKGRLFSCDHGIQKESNIRYYEVLTIQNM